MIEVVFLGVGAAIPVRGRTNTSFLVRARGLTILIDCGPAVLQQLAAVGLTPGDVTHVVFTHRHGDHTLGYPLFMAWWATQSGRPPDEFATTAAGRTTWETLDVLLEHSFGELSRKTRSAPRLGFRDTEPDGFRLGNDLAVQTWSMEHSGFAPVSGLRLEAGGTVFAFTSDTGPCANILPLAHSADLLVHEAMYSADLSPEVTEGQHGHSTARGAGRNAAVAGARRLALVHIDARYAGRHDALVAEAAREFAGPVTAPAAGDSYSFSDPTE